MSHLSVVSDFRHKTKKFLEQLFDIRLLFDHQKMHGINYFDDIKKQGDTIEIIFDVGANIGQSTYLFRENYSNARIFCFEPIQSTFDELEKNVKHPLTSCYRLALGAEEKKTDMFLTYQSLTHTLIEPDDPQGTESVQVTTIDTFASKHEINKIDLLKIDTEGYDLEVLKGALGMLDERKINYILVETGFHPDNEKHILLDTFRDVLTEKGYVLFGIYQQELERTGEKKLRLANAMFCKKQDD